MEPVLVLFSGSFPCGWVRIRVPWSEKGPAVNPVPAALRSIPRGSDFMFLSLYFCILENGWYCLPKHYPSTLLM